MKLCGLLFSVFIFVIISDIEAKKLKRQSGREFAVPDPSDVLDKTALPPLVFPGQKHVGLVSGHDKNLETIRNQIKELKLNTGIANGAGSVLGMIPKAGGAIKATVSTLASYLGSVTQLEELKTDVKIELGIDKAIVRHSLSNLKAEIDPLKSRLDEMTNPSTTNEEKKYSVIPAIHSCQKISQLFADTDYIIWNYKSIFAPYLVSFISLYTTTARLAAELLPSQKVPLGNEMGILLQTLNKYEPDVVRNMLNHIVIYNENALSKKVCPKIKVFYTHKDFSKWDQKIREWKSTMFYPQKSGCVLGDENSEIVLHSYDVFHRAAKVFKNEISGDLFCGWENCWTNLREIYYGKLRTLFEETRSLFPEFTNRNVVTIPKPPPINGAEDDCERDAFGRLSYKPQKNSVENSYGCHKGYCWAYCFIPFSWQNDWCYTSHRNSKYVRCTKKEDCCPEWTCGGACWAY